MCWTTPASVRTGDGSLVNEIIEEGFTALKEDEAK